MTACPDLNLDEVRDETTGDDWRDQEPRHSILPLSSHIQAHSARGSRIRLDPRYLFPASVPPHPASCLLPPPTSSLPEVGTYLTYLKEPHGNPRYLGTLGIHGRSRGTAWKRKKQDVDSFGHCILGTSTYFTCKTAASACWPSNSLTALRDALYFPGGCGLRTWLR